MRSKSVNKNARRLEKSMRYRRRVFTELLCMTAQRHTGQAEAILARREKVYQDARNRNPGRWSQDTRNWKLEGQVWLNPERIQPEALQQAA
jgi:hypothetical protein